MKINSARPLSGVQCLPKEHEPEEEKPVVTMRAAHESATRPLSRYPHCPPNTSDFVGVDKELNPEQYNAILNGSQRNEIIQTMLESNRAALANLQASANLRATESKLNRSKSSRIRNRISRIFNQ
ncbi:MAG: uncharacterized protein KVP18_004596 [Porospora cf. gigantea A]|uniref:uncharacterized protein n=1 Tax=Porospora cf. gigantea A TaxID=2853593 RepID=UPI00355A3C62|nr:MAG: hypothetical protein KVP18_004596 [Porospora cf. gigantea A]